MSLNNETLLLESNALVLTNVNELAAAVMTKIMGNHIANTIEGKPVTSPELRAAIAARQKSTLAPFLKA